ncbi:hypothetical protein [Mucilaginibacter segetis]|uniref:Uncharacterized protein n=1 Tax=Mucilaginibacter segetis TaxID=2793071 RepID=A0A934UKV2_9SPHI|nr:hypothetical protein [Mucilaginibacter segetis]MBK0377858.1 hypothetical protein [Mucilaginibacter segetis]
MKKYLFMIVLLAVSGELMAQNKLTSPNNSLLQKPYSLKVDTMLIAPSIQDYLKSPKLGSLTDLKNLNQLHTVAEVSEAKAHTMPIAVLEGYDRMPVIKLQGNSKMPIAGMPLDKKKIITTVNP